MKAITLWQPYATLVAIGAKRLETRGWVTRYRGPLAIHAAATFPARCRDLIMNLDAPAITEALHLFGYSYAALLCAMSVKHEVLPLGKMVGITNMVDCILITEDNAPPEPERSFGDYTPGRYMWVLDDVQRLDKPIPARGTQGLWNWEPPEGVPAWDAASATRAGAVNTNGLSSSGVSGCR